MRYATTLLVAIALVSCSRGADLDGSVGLSITAATYNIKHGRGMDDSVSLERTAAVLRTINADIIALQEVDELVNRSGNVDEAARLGELLEMNHAFGSFMDYDGGRYGMAILSKYPVVAINSIRLPEGEEPRVALSIDIELPGYDTVSVVSVHFDWIENDSSRFAQASFLAAHLKQVTKPWILLGDFNDLPESRTLALFRANGNEVPKQRATQLTFPSDEPVKEIDFIFVSADERWRRDSSRVIDEEVASDHRPVVATVHLID
jgi:endonuclease/exonuclease/phosphatase family metal-dependent hydrolase